MRMLFMIAALLAALPASAGLADLARSGDWERVVEVASRRVGQLPLSTSEAMIAAFAARTLGDLETEQQFLAAVDGEDDGNLSRLARAQIATLIQKADPARAVDLALPAFDRGEPRPVREAATEAAIGALENNLDADRRASVRSAARKLPKGLRRRLELALALSDGDPDRRALDRILAASTADLAALRAAESLSTIEGLTPVERWRIGKTWYRHALYDRAAAVFEELDNHRDASVPGDELAFLRGRCAFRRGRWTEALTWYRKALSRARKTARRADLEVHIARCYELSGDMDTAVEAAQRAVRTKTTDERRLFLARLRLRRGEPELAAKGIARLRSRKHRAHGEMMLAVDALQRGDLASTKRRLARITRRPWSGPAAVLGAELSLRDGDSNAALASLQDAAEVLDEFWSGRARDLMSRLGRPEIEQWRRHRRLEIEAVQGRARWRALGGWAVLEPDLDVLEEIRGRVEAELGWSRRKAVPDFPPGLAAELWSIGLGSEGARWDPAGFPRADAWASSWSAARFLEFGFPRRATRVADGAWRQAGAEVPTRAMPVDLCRALYPLPEPGLVRLSAATGEVDWALLAAMVREESRWDANALSAVGARGLVQLMPATAAAVAARVGASAPTGDDLFDPGISLDLGAAELGRLVEVFGGRRAPAVAAYNAGEAQARQWLEDCGDGCTDALYVANISFKSTRSYTADVLSAAEVYSELYARPVQVNDRTSSLPDVLRPVSASSRSPR